MIKSSYFDKKPNRSRTFFAAMMAFLLISAPGYSTTLYSNVSTETQLAPSLLNKDMRNGGVVEFPDDGDLYRDLIVTFNDRPAMAFNGTTSYAGRPTFSNQVYDILWVDSAPPARSTGVIFADFNNDGLPDFYSPNQFGHHLYQYVQGESETGFKDVTSEMGLQFMALADFNKTINGSWGDYDGDSYVDLLIVQGEYDTAAGSQKLRLLHNDQGVGFSNLGYQVGFSENKSAIMSGIWADLDKDNDVELVLVQSAEQTTAASVYYENKIHDNPSPTLVAVDAKIAGVKDEMNEDNNLAACTDMNNDGTLDLVYYSRYRYGVATTDETGLLNNCWDAEYGGYNPWVHDLAVFDANHDGNNDVLASLTNHENRFPRLWLADGCTLNNGTQIFEVSGISNDQTGMCVGDFTQDGNSEVFLTRSVDNVDDGAFFYDIYNPEGTSTNWVGFSVEAPDGLCNRMALGATIVLSSSDPNDSFIQAKLVDGGSGRASQGDHCMVFGLGSYTGNVDVEITLPNKGVVSGGSTISFYNLPIGQYHDLTLESLSVDDITAKISHNALTGKITLDVTWLTNTPTIWTEDWVKFHSEADDSLVPYQTVYIGGGDPQQSSGPYVHHMVISTLPCDSSKTFYISVGSNDGATAMASSTVEIPITKCLVPGDLPDPNMP